MAFHMELSQENLKALKDLGYDLSEAAEDHLYNVRSNHSKRMFIAYGIVSIHLGNVIPDYLYNINDAAQALILFNLGMTDGEIFKTIRGVSDVPIHGIKHS